MINPKTTFDFIPKPVDAQCESYQTRWQVPARLEYFNGHFPHHPIFPAVAMIDASIEGIRRILHLDTLRISSIKSSKFMQPVTPDLEVELSFQKKSETEWEVTWNQIAGTNSKSLLAQLNFVL